MFLTLTTPLSLSAQVFRVSGIVSDSISGDPIPFASVLLTGTDRGVLTNEDGRFELSTSLRFTGIQTSAMGYSTKTLPLNNKNNLKNIVIKLVPTGVLLNEVTAKPKKERYSKKNNPAVEFMQKIRATMDQNNPYMRDNYNYDKYERISFALDNVSVPDPESGDKGSPIFREFPWLIDHVGTSELSGNPILNFITREKTSTIHYRKDPENRKEIITGFRHAGPDDLIDQESVQKVYEDVLREIDVYQNDIPVLLTRFVSPLSRIAPDFYKFYLTDTVTIDTTRCIVLTFVPHNSESMGFTGRFYVTAGDSSMFIKRVELRTPHNINLNFIDNMLIRQDYDRAPDGARLKTRDEMILEASLVPGLQGLYVQRTTNYSRHNFEPVNDKTIFDSKSDKIQLADADKRDSTFWETNRLSAMTAGEAKVDILITRLRENKFYYWSEKILRTLFGEYIHTSRKSPFDIGPVASFVSSNDIEGLRLKVGGMTTANLSPRWFARGYLAYGFKDHRWKYNAELEYSFRDKKYHSREFPVHSIRATHLYDINMLGQSFTESGHDNLFLSLRRLKDRQITYHRMTSLEYNLELENNLSILARVKTEQQEATRYMTFVNGYGETFNHYTLNSFTFTLRYAPGEKFFQSNGSRQRINFDAPTLVLSHTVAPRGLFGNRFTVNKTEVSFNKRVWLSAFGYTDAAVKGAHVWSRVPYPNLVSGSANLSYIIQSESFALLNPLEFINDSYAMWNITYSPNGALLNRIPLLNRLKLREVFIFKGFFGYLSKKNNPINSPELFRFPEISHTMSMNPRTPYMEIGVGIDNILNIFRIDYMWRLTYRNNPDACREGLRIGAHISF